MVCPHFQLKGRNLLFRAFALIVCRSKQSPVCAFPLGKRSSKRGNIRMTANGRHYNEQPGQNLSGLPAFNKKTELKHWIPDQVRNDAKLQWGCEIESRCNFHEKSDSLCNVIPGSIRNPGNRVARQLVCLGPSGQEVWPNGYFRPQLILIDLQVAKGRRTAFVFKRSLAVG